MKFTHEDLQRAFKEWQSLPRDNMHDSQKSEAVEKAWRRYTSIRDWLAENYKREHLEKDDLRAFTGEDYDY